MSNGIAGSGPMAALHGLFNCRSASTRRKSRPATRMAFSRSNSSGWKPIGPRKSRSAPPDKSEDREMSQEVSNVEQRTPQTQAQQTPQRQSAERNVPRPVFVPPADIYETGDSLVVMVEMPGVASDGVDITLERRVLTIRARSANQQHAGYQRVYTEYADGDYERVFTLSED